MRRTFSQNLLTTSNQSREFLTFGFFATNTSSESLVMTMNASVEEGTSVDQVILNMVPQFFPAVVFRLLESAGGACCCGADVMACP